MTTNAKTLGVKVWSKDGTRSMRALLFATDTEDERKMPAETHARLKRILGLRGKMRASATVGTDVWIESKKLDRAYVFFQREVACTSR